MLCQGITKAIICPECLKSFMENSLNIISGANQQSNNDIPSEMHG